ncbi:MAG: winged helix-turn-helix transcriptional regulator [Oscillospiraceae bacterium]|nr:winged helix-turn-helix transcriptional regulator [Oscillospiraceae bacterium]
MKNSDLKRRKILRIIKDNGEISRVSIAARLGVSKAAICDTVNQMIAEGLLTESGEAPNSCDKIKKGRRRILLKINENYRFVVGMTVTQTFLNFGISTLGGKMLDSRTCENDQISSGGKISDFIVCQMRQLINDNCITEESLLGIGISFHPQCLHAVKDKSRFFNNIKKDVELCFGCNVLCADFVYSMAFMNIEFTPDLNVPVNNQLFLCISDKLYLTVIRDRVPVEENTDRFDSYLVYDKMSDSYVSINSLISQSQYLMREDDICILINNLLSVFEGFNMIIYSPDFTKKKADALGSMLISRDKNINDHILIYYQDRSGMFLGSCSMAVNKLL